MSLTPLQKHLKEQAKRRAKREILNQKLQESSGVVELPGEFIENVSVAYRDLQTSLNNLDKAARTIKSLDIGQQTPASQQSPDSIQESNLTSTTHQSSSQESLKLMNLSQPPTLSRVLRNLRNLETRQISTVKRYRKLFAILGFRQSFVDGLEGIVSVYADDSDPEINIEKNLGLMEDAQTE